jgi:serine/threonine protein kinase
MAEVYKAYQPGLDRYVSIKVLHGHLVDEEGFIGRFEREAHAIGRLRHPNIVQAVDFDREEETFFMVMEFIDGPTLKDELKARKAASKPFSFRAISLTFSALCSAIDYAHSRGMVHRDIKPANVMINHEGQVVLTDFGIARIMGATQYTQTGALSGTPAYMSPEQGQGERGDERSDIYALGVMLYETATGMVPYDADTPFAVIMKHISEPLPVPSTVNPNIPENVENVILKAMAKAPDDRYQTAGEMARALRDAVGVSPDENLIHSPLITVASAPKVEEVDPRTGPLSADGRTVSSGSGTGEATAWSSASGATTVASDAKKQPVVPILVGAGAVIVVLIVAGLVASIALSSSSPDTEATQSAIARATAATATAEQDAAIAAETAAAVTAVVLTAAAATEAVQAPTQTSEAATAVAERLVATEIAQATRDAVLVGGLLATFQAATVEAQATAQAATAETIASFTPTAISSDTPAPTDTPTPTFTPVPTATPVPLPTSTPAPAIVPPTFTPAPIVPTNTPTPETLLIPGGKLAFPVDDGGGIYDVFIVSMPDGKVINRIKGARQPNYRSDGKKLLINGERSSFGENVFETDPSGNIERPVSGSPTDSFPFYKNDGTTLAYTNPQLAFGSEGYQSYLFVQCSLKPPHQESDKCAAVADFLIIVPAGGLGDIIGTHLVWTFPGDQLAYKGCNSWAGGGRCGMYIVGSWATKRSSNGETPRMLVDGSSVTPTDAKNGLIAYQSRESGDWEVFIISESGGESINLSNNPGSADGLATISPDGNWVAFASNREGAWAIYAVPSGGGAAQKLFNFPKANPWGRGDREWTNERISWGP